MLHELKYRQTVEMHFELEKALRIAVAAHRCPNISLAAVQILRCKTKIAARESLHFLPYRGGNTE